MDRFRMRFALAVLAAMSLSGVLAGCDGGQKGTARDAVEAMPPQAKGQYEEQMKKAMGGPPTSGGPMGGAGRPPTGAPGGGR